MTSLVSLIALGSHRRKVQTTIRPTSCLTKTSWLRGDRDGEVGVVSLGCRERGIVCQVNVRQAEVIQVVVYRQFVFCSDLL